MEIRDLNVPVFTKKGMPGGKGSLCRINYLLRDFTKGQALGKLTGVQCRNDFTHSIKPIWRNVFHTKKFSSSSFSHL